MKAAWFVLVSLLGLATMRASAQDCHPPGSFYRTSTIRGSLVMQPGAGTGCDLVATLNPDNDATGSAFAWYQLSTPVTTQWRISFRLDLSQVPPPSGPFDILAGILAATSAKVHPAADGAVMMATAHVFGHYGSGGDKPFTLSVGFACNSVWSSNGMCFTDSPDSLADGDVLRIELNIGAGSAGFGRWWINGEFTDPPTGEIDDLDNTAWGGVTSVALGTFNLMGPVQTTGTRIRISDIEVADDAVFAAGFDY